jgi:hypothetical protein
MTTERTFWLSFNDLDAPPDKRFLGVVILDLETDDIGKASEKAWELGLNPGGTMYMQDVTDEDIRPEYKDRLIRDDETLIKLGSGGRNPEL